METATPPVPTRLVQAGEARAQVFASRAEAGLAAAIDVGRAIASRQRNGGRARVVFAAAPSQNEFLAALVAQPSIDWSRVVAYHMDEYLGLGPDHPASFRRYLREHLFGRCGLSPDQMHLIAGESKDRPLRVCLDYEERLRRDPPDVVCAGIGENGHLAFNDPPVADFLDPVWVKVVRLDDACRAQQVNDGCFATIDEVPTHAYTLTISALLAASFVAVVVPGSRKAEAVRKTIEGPVSEACPASALTRHAGAKIYLDHDSARLLKSV